MSFVGDFIGDVVGGITGAKQAGKAAEKAGQMQERAAFAGIEEQRRQFDLAAQILAPYVEMGLPAAERLAPVEQAGMGALGPLSSIAQNAYAPFEAQMALAGVLGPDAQRAAIQNLETSPEFRALVRQGEEAILQNASATGGLRGGNVQAALGQFRPAMLQNLINTQYERLGGLTGTAGTVAQNLLTGGTSATTRLAELGQASATGQAAQATQLGRDVASLLGTGAQSRAGGVLAQGAVPRQAFGDLMAIGKMALPFI